MEYSTHFPGIDSIQISAYVRKLELDNEHMAKRIEELERDAIDIHKFELTTLLLVAVAQMHNVDPRTIRSYIEDGYIVKHPVSTDAKFLIRASDQKSRGWVQAEASRFSGVRRYGGM